MKKDILVKTGRKILPKSRFRSYLGKKFQKQVIDENNNKAILGAIIPFNTFTYFIKLNTTKKGVDKIEPDFIKFCSSFKSIRFNI